MNGNVKVTVRPKVTDVITVRVKDSGPPGISGGMQALIYDPNSVVGDAFNMANMAEAVDAKILSLAEREKLALVEDGATRDQTDEEIRVLVGSAVDSNVFTDADKLAVNHANLANLNSINQDLSTVSDVNFRNLAAYTMQLDLAYNEVVGQGQFGWNQNEETVDLGLNGAVLQIGQEVHYHVRNSTGVRIDNGSVVMASGTIGASGRITVAPMDGTSPANAKFILGIATEDIDAGTDGKVSYFGKVRGIDTSAWLDGDVLYVSPTVPGALTNISPVAPLINMPVAFVILSHLNAGVLSVRVHPTDENSFSLYTHKIEDHLDTDATGANLNTLTNFSNADLLHVHTFASIAGFDDAVTNNAAVLLNTAKVANVTTNLSEGTPTEANVVVVSSDGLNATLVGASATRAGILTKAKFDEIVLNSLKVGVTTQISSISEDTVPTLGANLLTDGFDILFESLTGIRDSSGNEQLIFGETPSAINYFHIQNSAAGAALGVSAQGEDANIDILLSPKGTGKIKLGTLAVTSDQAVGPAVDTYVLTYDNATGFISLKATAAAGLSNLVEDSTPQLGGELDAQANTIGFTLQAVTGDGSTTIDWKLGNKFEFTFGAQSDAFTFTPPTKPCSLTLVLVQDSVGGRTIVWPAGMKWANGSSGDLSIPANSVDIVSMFYDGTSYYSQLSNGFL